MTEESQDSAPTAAPSDWSASQYEAALSHLEQLQQQLNALRSTIPMLVAPLVQLATSKAQMFVEVRKAALHATESISAFRDDWSSEQTQQLFAKSKQSYEENGDLSKAGEVARYGWVER